MDEPCSALDPISTGVIEELIGELRRDLAVVIVTHNLAQAHRVADKVAFMYLGDLVEYGTTAEVFEEPRAHAHARLRARRVRMSLRAPGTDGGAVARGGRGEPRARPLRAEHATCANCGARSRRPALLPGLRPARLARAARVPGRAAGRRPALRPPARLPSGRCRPATPPVIEPVSAAQTAGCAATRACSGCSRCCCWRHRRPAGRPLGHPEQGARPAGREGRRPHGAAPPRPARGGEHDADEHDRQARATTPSGRAKASAKNEAKEVSRKPRRSKRKRRRPRRSKVSSTKLKKLGRRTGKKHQEEINALGAQPIETG